MYPPVFLYPDVREKAAERRFYDACRNQLGDEWTVLYERYWFGHRDGMKKSGEADYVMLHAELGVFVVEVKGGKEIIVDHGEWYSVPHGRSERKHIRNPFKQVADSKFVLWDYIREKVPSVKLKGELGHMVVLPGHRQVGDISPHARRDLICDREDMRDLEKTLKRVARQFTRRPVWTQEEIQRLVVELMEIEFKLLGPRRIEYEDHFDQLKLLTDMQLRAFAMLRKHKVLTIHGGAGSGKTILANHRSLELAVEGKRVLFVCHSTELAEFLRDELESRLSKDSGLLRIKDQIHFSSIYEFARKLQGKMAAKHSRRFETGELSGGSFSDACLLASDDDKELFDALVIDEAQEIPSTMVDGLLLLLRKDGLKYIFGDPNQKVIKSGRNEMSALTVHGSREPTILNVNCRSSKQIADFANKIIQIKSEDFGSGFEEVEIVKAAIPDLCEKIVNVVQNWGEEFDLSNQDIKILYDWEMVRSLIVHDQDGFIDEHGFSQSGDFAVDWNFVTVRPEHFRNFEYFRVNFKKFPGEHPVYENEILVDEKFRGFFERNSDEIRKSALEFAKYENLRAKPGRVILDLTDFRSFIGLEARAVIAVLPLVSRGGTDWNGYERFARIVYTMATRAQSLLAIVGEPEAISLLSRLEA